LSYLLDTNVISELRSGERADPSVTAWFADKKIFLSGWPRRQGFWA
jgi:predicted nucleic acid-binding protein